MQLLLSDLYCISDTDFVSMRIVTFPACESFIFQFEMGAFLILTVYLFKMVFGKFLITAMTVDAIILLLHSELS